MSEQKFQVCSLSCGSMVHVWQIGKQEEKAITSLLRFAYYYYWINNEPIFFSFLVRWIRNRYPDPNGDYTGFIDINGQNT